jgi:anaerobic magnesium-protoporphyrin IX monomethyl ester cyclase
MPSALIELSAIAVRGNSARYKPNSWLDSGGALQGHHNMIDLLLIFPPQWSPFQPPLSIPSLTAWLRRAGLQVGCLDANILFYEWLLSDEAARILIETLSAVDLPDQEKEVYASVLGSTDYRADIRALKQQDLNCIEDPKGNLSKERFLEECYANERSLSNYLAIVSRICGTTFEITPYQFRLSSGNLNSSQLEDLVTCPHNLLGAFADYLLREIVTQHSASPPLIGFSCIGQEQLYFTLLLGHRMKKSLGATIIVGGTIFSRIFERGALRAEWFGKVFDIIVRNEGERPTERILANLRLGLPLVQDVPSIVYRCDGAIVSSDACPPLLPAEVPIPDFDDMPLSRYLSSDVTLPLLASRGCYWGKCEFCHHGMVYGEKYMAYTAECVLDSVTALSKRYGVRHFAFNDEAIPPKIARKIGEVFPARTVTGWNFTGLIKFERFYDSSILTDLARIGMRSLYVGLESASERVLTLMRKNTKKEIMLRNLRDATHAGIWMHCFLFFGFPGEREEDAQETYDFIMSNTDVIGSFGCGTFSLEHNAPIQKHLEHFGVQVGETGDRDLDVYYAYEVAEGVGPNRAEEWANALNMLISDIPKYAATSWIPREHLLCLLSRSSPEELAEAGSRLMEERFVPLGLPASQIFSLVNTESPLAPAILINRINGNFFRLPLNLVPTFRMLCESNITLRDLRQINASLFARITGTGGHHIKQESHEGVAWNSPRLPIESVNDVEPLSL